MFQNARQANPAPRVEAKRIGGNRLCFRFLSVISFGRAPEGAAAERCPRPRSAKTEPAESAELRRNCTRKKPLKHQIADPARGWGAGRRNPAGSPPQFKTAHKALNRLCERFLCLSQLVIPVRGKQPLQRPTDGRRASGCGCSRRCVHRTWVQSLQTAW